MAPILTIPSYHTNTPLDPSFENDIRDVHLIYDYDAQDEQGNPQKWRYEIWFQTEARVVYAIHGGPMKGRLNYQTAAYQCIRPGELWQISWLEETGTVVSMVYDIAKEKMTTCIAFSKGHWEHPDQAHGDKRNPEDFNRWRKLADLGNQRDRLLMAEQAVLKEKFRGKGDLVPIAPDAVTL